MASSHGTGYGGGAAALTAGGVLIAVSAAVNGSGKDIDHQPLFWLGIVAISIGVVVLFGVGTNHLVVTLRKGGGSDKAPPVPPPEPPVTAPLSQSKARIGRSDSEILARQKTSMGVGDSASESVIARKSRDSLGSGAYLQPASPSRYREIYVSAHYLYRRRTPSRVIVHRTIQAIWEPITEFKVPFNLPNDLHEGIGTFEALTNCSLVSSKYVRSTGTTEWTLAIPTSSTDEPVSFSYEIKMASVVDDRPYLRHIARAEGLHFVLEVQFYRNDLPASVHSFEKLDLLGPNTRCAG